MKGTVPDFPSPATEKPELAQDLATLAKKYDFVFTDEISDDMLEMVAGGATGDIAQTGDNTLQSDDAQLANIDLQNQKHRQQRIIQAISNVSKMLQDTANAVQRKAV